jgi:inner membrane protein
MATAFTHAFVGAALLPAAPPELRGWKLGATLAAVSVLPDLDVIGLALDVPYGHALGHRGFSHSLGFAALMGIGVPALLFPRLRRFSGKWWRVAALTFIAVASHGVLDAFTDAGRGIAFFLPVDATRYFFPWRPLLTPPAEPLDFFQERGLRILKRELLWIWVPIALLLTLIALDRLWRRRAR